MATPKRSRLIACAAIAAAVVWMGSCAARQARPAYTRWKLMRQLGEIEAWTASTNYSADGWKRLARVAGTFQQADPQLAADALEEDLRRHAGNPAELAVEQGKLFLLTRMMFDLPEHASIGPRVFDSWTRGNSEVNVDGTTNFAWPLALDHGQPRLVAGCGGTAGRDYSIRDEYTYLRYKFKYRDLTGLR